MRARLEQIIGEVSQMRDLLILISKGYTPIDSTKPTEVTTSSDEDGKDTDAIENMNSPARLMRMQTLRSQQAAVQLSKSEGELHGVEVEIGQIRLELVNNRIDSEDRRTRLEDKVRKPLVRVLEQLWPAMATEINSLEKLAVKSTSAPESPAAEVGSGRGRRAGCPSG